MIHPPGVPARQNSLRYPLDKTRCATRSTISPRSRFSFGAPQQRRVNRATAAEARHRRSIQTALAASKGASQPPSQPLDDDNEHEDERMGRKGRKGKGAAAGPAAGGSGGMREATLVRVSKVLEDFRASNAEGSRHSLPFTLAPVLELWSGGLGVFERV
jgi:ferric-dicitrate binding protein FerR (iron transport regulator)